MNRHSKEAKMGKATRFNEQKYIETALSKDIGRGALEYAYRDKDRLIGCDGHRLHMITGLPVVEKPYLIAAGSYDGEYPQYELAMPAIAEERFVSNITVNKRDMKRLKALSDFVGVENNPVAAFHTEGNMLHISYENIAETVKATLVIELDKTPRVPVARDSKMGIDLRYLYQALIQDVDMELYTTERGVVLKTPNTYALIMKAAL